MVTLDSSGIIASLDRLETNHTRVVAALRDERGPFIIPVGILAETSYFVEHQFGTRALAAFVDDLVHGRYTLDCGEEYLPRVHELIRRYQDLPLGLADAMVIACAEQHGGRVLTLDLRHFGVVAREGTIVIVP